MKVVGDHLEASVFYVVSRPGGINELYQLVASYPLGTTVKFCFTFPSGNTSNQRVRLWSDVSPLSLGQYTIWDIETGSLLEVNQSFINSEAGGYTLSFRGGYFPRTTGIYDPVNDFNYGYPIYPSNMQVYVGTYPEVLNVTPFVTWSLKPPDHNIYHSHLSEPEWDKYNRYFVLDDKLYWISIRLNGFYLKESDIEGSTGYYQYEALAPAQGGYDNGVVGVLAQYSGYIPVNLSSSVFFDDLPFTLCLVADTEQWAIRIQSNPLFSDIQTKVDYDLFVSEFNLEDGSYISSSFTHETHDLLNTAQYALFESGVFSSVHCYGIDFYNFRNLPINLSDVDWEYDLEFVQWRDSMLSTLNQIYSLLSGDDQSVPEPGSYPDFGGSLNEAESGYSDITPENVAFELQGALGAGSYDSAASQVRDWINLFSIPKIISVCVLALALGTVTLTLGKKKSD